MEDRERLELINQVLEAKTLEELKPIIVEILWQLEGAQNDNRKENK